MKRHKFIHITDFCDVPSTNNHVTWCLAYLKLGLKERYKGAALKNCIEVRQRINRTPLPAISCLWGVFPFPPAPSSPLKVISFHVLKVPVYHLYCGDGGALACGANQQVREVSGLHCGDAVQPLQLTADLLQHQLNLLVLLTVTTQFYM